LVESFTQKVWKEVLELSIDASFRQISWYEAMTTYGSDKPDVRYGLELTTITDAVRESGFGVFKEGSAKKHGVVALLNAKGCADFSRKQIDELAEHGKKYGAKGLAWMKFQNGEVSSPILKFLNEREIESITSSANAEEGDLLLFATDEFERCYTILGALRVEVAKRKGILEGVKNKFEFLWVVDFPLMEFSEEEQRYIARHHPFTSPMDEDVPLLETDPTQARAKAYDLVCNGYEIAGGSIRIHRSEIQQKMFDLLGFTREDAESKFGFLLDALKYGAPPHGGIALGFDRWVMLLCGTDNIRDVVAFPKTTSGLSLMDGCPSDVDSRQLKELGIQTIQ
jgi:aspartyl-tRNA synthetase